MSLPELVQSPYEKVTTICQLVDNYSLVNEQITLQAGPGGGKTKKPKPPFTPCKGAGPEILLQQIDPSKGKAVILKKYTSFDKVLSPNIWGNDLRNYMIYANTSPVSYFLNGFNAAILCVGIKGSCKSRILFGGDLSIDTAASDSLVCTLVEEIMRYTEQQNATNKSSHPLYTIGVSMADVVYSDADRTEILLDLLRVKENDNKNAELSALTNVQITTYQQFEKALAAARFQSQNWAKRTSGEYQILSNKSHSIIKISMYQQKTSQMSNLVIIDCCGLKVEEDANAKRGYLDFSLKQIQDFLLDYANNKTATEIKVDLDRKTKIVRVIANLFLKNSKMFLLCPVLTHAPPTVNKYLLDMVEGIGNVGTIIEVAPPIPKKDAKFVYFSVFNMKNQSSRLFMKKPKLGKSRITVNRTLEKSTEKTILTDNDSDTSQPNQSLKPLKQVPSFVQSPNPNLRKLTGSTLDYNYPSFDATKPGSKLSKKVGLTKPILSVKTPSSTKMDLSGYKARIEKVAQSMDVGSNLEEKYEFDAKSHLKKRFPISKNAEQLVDELGNRVLELELENKQTKYLYKNMVKDLENKLAYAYQKLQMLEGKTPYHELFETYNKEMRKYEKQIELIRNSFVETITAHELAYNSILQKDNVGRKDKLLLNEMRVLQRNNRKFLVDLKTKDLELTAFKSKEKTWIAEHKELDDLRKEAVKYQKELTRTENTIQSNEVAMEGSEKAMAHLKSQYDALDVKNRENEKLIMALQGQIDRLTVKLQAGKIMDKLDKPLKLPKLIPNTGPFEIPERKDKGSLQPAPLTVDKAVLVKTHSQIKQCKAQITETLKTVRDETKEYANANLFAATDSLERAIALLLKILGDLEMRELNYLNTISQFTGSSPLRG